MAVTHVTALREDLCDAVLAFIDADAAAGNLVFMTSGDVEVATCPLAYPAGTVSGATLTFDCTPALTDTNATGGTVAKAKIETNGNVQALGCAVGTSGSDINLSSLTVGAGDTVTVTALSYTASA